MNCDIAPNKPLLYSRLEIHKGLYKGEKIGGPIPYILLPRDDCTLHHSSTTKWRRKPGWALALYTNIILIKGFSLISQVARGRKMRIQDRRSGRMVEESMGSLGIDSRCLDIRVTAGREEERSTTELLATSWKGKDKTTFRTFLLVQTFE